MLGIFTLIAESLLRPRRVYEGVVARGFDRVPIDLVVVALSFLTYPLVRSTIRLTSEPTFLPSVVHSLLRSLVIAFCVYVLSFLADYLLLKAFKTDLTLKRVRTAFVWTLPLRMLGGATALFLLLNVPDQLLGFEYYSGEILLFAAYLPFVIQTVRLLSEALNLKLRYAALLVCFNFGLQELVIASVKWADRWVPALERGILG